MEVDDDGPLIEEFRVLGKHTSEFTKKCSSISQEIRLGTFTIVQLVEQLKNLLVNTSPESRELGMLVLSEVLEFLPGDLLESAQLKFICNFYADRLNDHHQVVPPTLRGVVTLTQFENIPEGSTTHILNSLFQNVPCQQQQQADRYSIYKILNTCLEKRMDELQQMNVDFVYGLISAMEGERDPRNLSYLFSWLPKFLKNFTLGHLTEEMFEVLACYFPVDFRAPSQDPNSISRESLAEALSTCLSCTPQFAEYCLPLALEKLSSSLRIAKLDSLHIIAEGCKTFAASQYIEHSTDIWSQIQREVLNCADEELAESALKTLEIVINKLSLSTESIFKRILSDITDTLKGNLLPHVKLFTPSCRMLCHVARACKKSASYIVSEIVPLLANTFNITKTTSHRVLVFRSLIDLVNVYIDVHQNDDITNVEQLRVIPHLCLTTALHNDDEMRAAGFLSLSSIAKSLSPDLRKCLYENLKVFLVSERSHIVNDALLKCLKVMSALYGEEIQRSVIDVIRINNSEALHLYLNALEVVVDQEHFMEVVLPIFVDNCLKDDIITAQVATGSLKTLLELHEDNRHIYDFLVHKMHLVVKLTDWILDHLHCINLNSNMLLLENATSVCKLLISFQPSEVQCNMVLLKVEKIITLYRDKHNGILLVVLDGLLERLHRDVAVDHALIEDLLGAALKLTSNEKLQHIVLQLLANILNKATNEETLRKDLDGVKSRCNSILNSNSSSAEELSNAVQVLSWTTKALAMRGHQNTETFINQLLSLLEDERTKCAASGFKIILNDDCSSLSSKSFCIKKPLYRQKFFVEVSTKLVENCKEKNPNYLLAIGYLLQETPQQVVILHFNKILRLIILCLEQCDDAEVLCAVLETLCTLIQKKEPLTEDHIQEFLPRFLRLATFKASMQVRMKALQCVRHYSQGYPIYKLLPYKQEVIHSLSRCLDDKKRLVRKEAVEARLCWFLLDAPT